MNLTLHNNKAPESRAFGRARSALHGLKKRPCHIKPRQYPISAIPGASCMTPVTFLNSFEFAGVIHAASNKFGSFACFAAAGR